MNFRLTGGTDVRRDHGGKFAPYTRAPDSSHGSKSTSLSSLNAEDFPTLGGGNNNGPGVAAAWNPKQDKQEAPADPVNFSFGMRRSYGSRQKKVRQAPAAKKNWFHKMQ